MTTTNPEDCQVCMESYDEEKRRPRTLLCGHPFCSSCITNMMKEAELTCPTCCVRHKAFDATQFPVNYGMEELLKKLKKQEHSSGASEKGNKYRTRGLSRKLRSLVQDQESKIDQLLPWYHQTQERLLKYQAQLMERKEQQEQLFALLVEHQESVMHQFTKEQISVKYFKEEGEEHTKQWGPVRESLGAVKTPQEACVVINDSDQTNTEVEDWIQKCEELFPDQNIITNYRKMMEATKKALELVGTNTYAVPDSDLQDETTPRVIDALLDNTTMPPQAKVLNAEELVQLQERVKGLLELGQVVAVHQDQDCLRWSRITYSNKELHFHTLLEQPIIPIHTKFVEHGTVVGLLSPSSRLTFLDLALGGTWRERVYIRLNPCTGFALQFFLLCTDQQGPSYKTTRFLQVWDKGSQYERVRGGDYEYNTGEGGTPLLEGLHKLAQDTGQDTEGTVWAWWGAGLSKCAQFFIRTSYGESNTCRSAFGQVERGMDVVKAAVQEDNIQDVTVMDCGVVLPL